MLKVYDQPEGFVITDGQYQLYIDESEFGMRDDTTALDEELRDTKPSYTKKIRLIENHVYNFEDIDPVNKMVILSYKIYDVRISYVYNKDRREWLRTDNNSWVKPDDFRPDYKFKILFVGVE